MLISVVIPVYNKEKYLEDCIKSVLNQDYEKIEIIIINDGSRDNSESILRKWIEVNSNIKYISQENRGVAFARNRGVRLARGSYIFFLDADDILEKSAISKLVGSAKQSSADIVVGNLYVKIGDKVIKRSGFKNMIIKDKDLELTKTKLEMFLVNGRHLAMAGNKLYKKEFITKHQITFLDGVIAEDRLFNLMCYVNNPIIHIVNEYTYIYNKINDSRSRKLNSNFYFESIALLNYFYNYLKEKSLLDRYYELFQLIVVYDVYKIIHQTFEYTKPRIFQTKLTIKKLRNNSLLYNAVTATLEENKHKIKCDGYEVRRILLINRLLLSAPDAIIIYKIFEELFRKIKLKLLNK